MILFLLHRCPAKVRAYKKSGKIDMINTMHNHAIGIPPQKWRNARKKAERTEWILKYTPMNLSIHRFVKILNIILRVTSQLTLLPIDWSIKFYNQCDSTVIAFKAHFLINIIKIKIEDNKPYFLKADVFNSFKLHENKWEFSLIMKCN